MKRTQAELDAMPSSDFAMPGERKFPIVDQADVDAAGKLYGKEADADAVKSAIMRLARKRGLDLPDSWTAQDDEAGQFVDRPARLFVAGDYPKKGMNVTRDDLLNIANGTNVRAGANVQVGHTEPEFSLGKAFGLYVQGQELWGQVRLKRAAWELVQETGVNSLSVAMSRDKTFIQEVSLTGDPHVPSARLFSGAGADVVVFTMGDDAPEGAGGSEAMTDEERKRQQALEDKLAALEAAQATFTNEAASEREKRQSAELQLASMQAKAARLEAEQTIARFSDRVPPAARELAITLLLQQGATVRFADKDVTPAALFTQFVEALPAHFKQPLRTGNSSQTNSEMVEFTAEQLDLGKKMGYSAEQMEKMKQFMPK